jgi:hypothetical protein
MSTVKDIDIRCPHCGVRHNAATWTDPSYGGTKISDGDIGVCIDCGEVYIVCAEGAAFRKPLDEELTGIPDDLLKEIMLVKAARLDIKGGLP